MSTLAITCLREPGSGRTWELEQGRTLTVGRSEGNDWVFSCRSISRQHAILDWPEGSPRATVRDLDSANGTQVDGYRVPPHEPVPLTHRCRVQFGELSFEVLLLTKQVAESSPRTASGRFVRLVTNGRKALSGAVRGWDELQDFLLKLESVRATGTLKVRLPHREVSLALVAGQLLPPAPGAEPVPTVLREWDDVATCQFVSAPRVEVEATSLDGAPVAPSALFASAGAHTRRLTREDLRRDPADDATDVQELDA